MPLYPTTIVDADDPATMYMIPPGCAWARPVSLSSGQISGISLLQLSLNEDFSMRVWFSEYPGGIPLVGDGNLLYFQMGRIPLTAILYDNALPQPGVSHTFPLAAGDYFLNVLNLVNSESIFSYATGPLN